MPHPRFHPFIVIGALVGAILLFLVRSPPPEGYLPDQGRLDLQQARAMAESGDYDAAIIQLQRLLNLYPDNTGIWNDYLSLLRRAGRGQELLQHLPMLHLERPSTGLVRTLVAAAEETAPHGYALLHDTAMTLLPQAPELAATLYRRLLELGYDGAMDLLTEAWVSHPGAENLGVILAREVARENRERATGILLDYLASWPDDAEARSLWSRLLVRTAADGRPADALALFNHESLPGHIVNEMPATRWALLVLAGEPEPVAADIEAMDPVTLEETALLAAEKLLSSGRDRAAASLFEMALQPSVSPRLALGLAQLRLEQGAVREALDLLGPLPRDDVAVLLTYVRGYEQLGEYSRAVDFLEMAIALDNKLQLTQRWADDLVQSLGTITEDRAVQRLQTWQGFTSVPPAIATQLSAELQARSFDAAATVLQSSAPDEPAGAK